MGNSGIARSFQEQLPQAMPRPPRTPAQLQLRRMAWMVRMKCENVWRKEELTSLEELSRFLSQRPNLEAQEAAVVLELAMRRAEMRDEDLTPFNQARAELLEGATSGSDGLYAFARKHKASFLSIRQVREESFSLNPPSDNLLRQIESALDQGVISPEDYIEPLIQNPFWSIPINCEAIASDEGLLDKDNIKSNLLKSMLNSQIVKKRTPFETYVKRKGGGEASLQNVKPGVEYQLWLNPGDKDYLLFKDLLELAEKEGIDLKRELVDKTLERSDEARNELVRAMASLDLSGDLALLRVENVLQNSLGAMGYVDGMSLLRVNALSLFPFLRTALYAGTISRSDLLSDLKRMASSNSASSLAGIMKQEALGSSNG